MSGAGLSSSRRELARLIQTSRFDSHSCTKIACVNSASQPINIVDQYSRCFSSAAVREQVQVGLRRTGTVSKWINRKGIGFITPDGGKRENDLLVHYREIKQESVDGFKSLAYGSTVEYDTKPDPKDPTQEIAVNVTGIDGVDCEARVSSMEKGKAWVEKGKGKKPKAASAAQTTAENSATASTENDPHDEDNREDAFTDPTLRVMHVTAAQNYISMGVVLMERTKRQLPTLVDAMGSEAISNGVKGFIHANKLLRGRMGFTIDYQCMEKLLQYMEKRGDLVFDPEKFEEEFGGIFADILPPELKQAEFHTEMTIADLLRRTSLSPSWHEKYEKAYEKGRPDPDSLPYKMDDESKRFDVVLEKLRAFIAEGATQSSSLAKEPRRLLLAKKDAGNIGFIAHCNEQALDLANNPNTISIRFEPVLIDGELPGPADVALDVRSYFAPKDVLDVEKKEIGLQLARKWMFALKAESDPDFTAEAPVPRAVGAGSISKLVKICADAFEQVEKAGEIGFSLRPIHETTPGNTVGVRFDMVKL